MPLLPRTEPPSPSPTRPSQGDIPGLPNPHRTRPGVIVGSVVGAVVAVFLLLFAVFWWRNKGCVARPRPRQRPQETRESFETARTHPKSPTPAAGHENGLLTINTDHLAPRVSADMSPRDRMLALYANQSRTSLASHASHASHVSRTSHLSANTRSLRASADLAREPLPEPSSPTPFGRRPPGTPKTGDTSGPPAGTPKTVDTSGLGEGER